jgi:hypothetical protein
MFNQMGGGGFAIGARDPNQANALTGVIPKSCRQLTGPASNGIRNNHHCVALLREPSGSCRRANQDRGSSISKGFGPKASSIHTPARKTDEHTPGPHATGIAGDRFDHCIG